MSTDNSFFHHKGVKVAKGDEVVIVLRGEVTWVGSDRALSLDRHHVLNPAHYSFQSVRVIPPPIKVGDTVRTKSDSLVGIYAQRPNLNRGVVVAIDNYCQQAWVKPVFSGLASRGLDPKNDTWNLSELELVP